MVLLAVAVLIAVFVGAAVLPLNMGLLALAGAFVTGVLFAGLSPKEVLAGFPGDLFVTLVGITYLFSLAQRNGAIDQIVRGAARLTGGKAASMPFLVFTLAAILTALGALGPAAVAITAPVAMRFARQHGLSPLMMGLMAIHGAQAGAFSPISVYGGITNQVLARAGLHTDPVFLAFASFAFNASLAVLIFIVLRPRASSEPVSIEHHDMTAQPVTRDQMFTFIGLTAFAALALAFRMDIGFTAMLVLVALAIVAPASHAGGLKGVDWSTVLLICGVVTYVGVMQEIGAIDSVSSAVAAIAMPLLALLLICYLAGLISAFASSTALLGVMIPLAQPLFGTDPQAIVLIVAAIAISTTIVDTSPFSTNGALVVANADEEDRQPLFRKLLIYTSGVVVLGPLLAWLIFIVSWGAAG